MMHSEPTQCLLCSHNELQTSASLTGKDLRILWDTLANPVGEKAFGPLTPETVVFLYRCKACGFRFYNPEFAGSAEFYEELMATKTYPLGSPEFDHAIAFARQHGIKQVLDVGGGEGAFLDQAKEAGLHTSGVELNRNASEIASAKGHRMFNMMMEDIPLEELMGGTDLLTLFQVVEHVQSPVDFVRSASRLVKPGGYIAIAVPSDKRMLSLLENDPADWPPHHVSRWRTDDLRKLGERAGLDIVEHKFNPLYGKSIPWAFSLHNKLERSLHRPGIGLPQALVHAASLGHRALRLHRILPFHGLSIRAIYQKPTV